MRRQGFTLLELMTAIGILGIVMGILFALATGVGQAARTQEAKMTTMDEARSAMLLLTRELRQAASSSLAGSVLPGPSLSYCIARDADGNGLAVDVGCHLELSTVRTIQRDTADLNRDGVTVTQLVISDGNRVRVLTNRLLPNEDLNNNGTLDPGEDSNRNGRLERGLWFEREGRGIRITIQTEQLADPRGFRMVSSLNELVVPRN